MTEGQIRYRTLMEDQRHNLAVESINREQAKAASSQAASAAKRAEADYARAWNEIAIEGPYRRKLDHMETIENIKMGWAKTGTGIASSFLGGLGKVAALFA